MERQDFISIIIPVYNVYDWIDECMESVTKQTYHKFEVLLINDGSTDGSDMKCKEWAEKDGRIRVINMLHQGVQICRNIGVRESRGNYLIFIDADDWVELNYIQKLYERICDTDADLVECDFWRYNNATGEKTYRPTYGRMGVEYTREEKILYGESVVWKTIFKKDLWVKNQIEIPNCLGAAHVVYVLFLILNAKTANIHEALYYYRRMRKGSIIDVNGKSTKEEGRMGLDEMSAMIEELSRRGMYDSNRTLWEKAIKYRMSDLLAAQFARKNTNDFLIQYKNYGEFIEQHFGKESNNIYMNIGGYNLNRILSYLPEIHNPYRRFNFSSIISIMSPLKSKVSCKHKNKYRQIMIERDIASSFWKIIEEIKPSYVFIDFLEERFDIVEYMGGYITKSDAFDGLEETLEGYRIIPRSSSECDQLWKEKCLEFIARIQTYIPMGNIVVVKNYLSEFVGDCNTKEQFENIDEIRETNRRLEEYYQFFTERCEGISAIEVAELPMYFTDREYEYGAVPSHLNELVNREIAGKIEKCIKM